jgi:hypothetical protein
MNVSSFNKKDMIHKTRIRKLRNVEFLQFLDDMLMVCQKHITAAMTLDVFITALTKSHETYGDALKVSKGSSITEILQDLDNDRNNCLRGLRHILKGCSFHFDSNIRDAGERLLHEMDKYGTNLPNLNYPAKTIAVTSIYEDCTTRAELIGDVALLQLLPWLNELQNVNTAFSDHFVARSTEKGSTADIKARECRKAAIACYRTLVDQINARAILANDGSYDHVINTTNDLIRDYNRLADGHKRKKKPPSDEQE